MRVEICGGIAAGKTTLTRLLTALPARPVHESFRDNPFWQAFYAEPGQHVFETELTFLLQHYHQLKVAQVDTSQLLVADFSFVLDAAYADFGLKGARLRTFDMIRRTTSRELGAPALLIHLHCAPEIELDRIRARARPEESLVDVAFLARLNRAVARRVAKTARATRVLRIDSDRHDFANVRSIQERIIGMVRNELAASGQRRRHGRVRGSAGR